MNKHSLWGVILDNEFIIRQFEEIEKKVERLIDVCKSLEATNLELESKNKRLEEDIQSKTEVETNYAQEKTLIRSKVDNLLARLGEFENPEADVEDTGLER